MSQITRKEAVEKLSEESNQRSSREHYMNGYKDGKRDSEATKELLDEALKFVVCDESCNSSKGRGFRKCDCGAQALQEKIREARK